MGERVDVELPLFDRIAIFRGFALDNMHLLRSGGYGLDEGRDGRLNASSSRGFLGFGGSWSKRGSCGIWSVSACQWMLQSRLWTEEVILMAPVNGWTVAKRLVTIEVTSLLCLDSFGLGREKTLTKRPKKAKIKVDETFIVVSCKV